jgi:hypothetical protein
LAAHFIGEANFEKKQDPGKAFSSCSPGCIEGCYHGVMEAYLKKAGNSKDILSRIPELCDSVSNNNVLERQCLHGAGHGILRHQPEALLNAVGLCSYFKTQFAKDTCIGGVLMEYVDTYLTSSEEELIKQLPELCKALIENKDKKLIKRCFKAVGEGLMFYTGHNLEKSKLLCSRLEANYLEICVEGAIEENALNKSERSIL